MKHTHLASPHAQRGTALLFAFIVLVSLTFIAVSSVRTSVMELRIARNVEENMNAFQTAQAAVDFVKSDSANLPFVGPLNTPSTVALTGSTFATDPDETLVATAERTLDCGQPPRMRAGTSLLAFSSFSYRITADLDKTASGRGKSSIRQGVLVLGPKC